MIQCLSLLFSECMQGRIFMIEEFDIGDAAPDFLLTATDGFIYTLDQYKGNRGVVIFFTCNHCPYVQGSENYLMELAETYKSRGAPFVAINSNDSTEYPEDSFENMIKRDQEKNFPWPYLHDSSQMVALKYNAVSTPHFFLFDRNKNLVYRGQALDNPKDPSQSKTDHLKNALEDLLASRPIAVPRTEPVGCSIKWTEQSRKLQNATTS